MNAKITIIGLVLVFSYFLAGVDAGPVAGAACCALECAALAWTGPGCGACIGMCVSTAGVAGLIPGVCVPAFLAPTP